MTSSLGGAGDQEALFRAIADFNSLITQAQRAAGSLEQVALAGQGVGSKVTGGLGQAERGMSGFFSRMSQFTDKMDRFGSRATRSVTLPIVGLGALAVHEFADFDLAITKAGAKTSATGKQMQQMRDIAQQMGAQTVFSSTDAANALDSLAALGFNAKDSIAALPGVVHAAAAAGEDLGLTTETVARAMNAFNLKAKDSAHVADVFASAANTTALDIQGLSYGLGQAGETGARFGQKMEGVVAWLGRLVDMGVQSASAGVGIRQAFTSLSAPTDKASAYMKRLGLNVRDANGDFKQVPDLLEELATRLDTNNPKLDKAAKKAGMTGKAYRDMALKSIFGVEGAKAVSLAISDGKPVRLDAEKDAKELNKLQDQLAETMGGKAAKAWIAAHTAAGKFTATGADAVRVVTALGEASDGTAKKMSDKLGKTVSQNIDNAIGSLQSLAVTLIGTVAPAITDMLHGLQGLANWMAKFSKDHPTITKFVLGFLAVAAAIGPVVSIMAKFMKLGRGIGRMAIGIGRMTGLVSRRTSTTAAGAGMGPVEVFAIRPLPVEVINMGAMGMAGRTGAAPIVGNNLRGGTSRLAGGVPIVPPRPSLGSRARSFAGGPMGGALLGMGGMYAGSQVSDGNGGARDVLGSTLSYAGGGAMIGSMIPVVGTAAGAIAGGVFGLGKGLVDSLFGSGDDQKKEAQQLADAIEAAMEHRRKVRYREIARGTGSAASRYANSIVDNGRYVKSNAMQITNDSVHELGLAHSARQLGMTGADVRNAITGSEKDYLRVDDVFWKGAAEGKISKSQLRAMQDLRQAFLDASKTAREYADARGLALDGDIKAVKASDLLRGKTLDLTNRMIPFKDALDGVNEAVDENGTSLQANSKFGQANIQSIQEATLASLAHAQAVTKRTGSVKAGLETLQKDRKKLLEAADAAGLNKKRTRELIDMLLTLDGTDPKSDVKVNFHRAREETKKFGRWFTVYMSDLMGGTPPPRGPRIPSEGRTPADLLLVPDNWQKRRHRYYARHHDDRSGPVGALGSGLSGPSSRTPVTSGATGDVQVGPSGRTVTYSPTIYAADTPGEQALTRTYTKIAYMGPDAE